MAAGGDQESTKGGFLQDIRGKVRLEDDVRNSGIFPDKFGVFLIHSLMASVPPSPAKLIKTGLT